MTKSRFFLGAGFLALLFIAPSVGMTQLSSDDMKKLQDDIRAIKEGQKALSNDLQEIKKLLSARGEDRSPVRDVSTVLNVAEIPFKGDKQAVLTLVEFTDYQ